MPQPKKRKTAGGEDRWDVRTRIGRRVVTRTFVRKRDATAYASTIEADKLRGVAVDPRRARITLGEYGWRWLRMRTDLRPTTRANYENLLRRHILPALGDIELGDLDTSTVRAWHLELRGRHTSTAHDAYRLLRAILNTAVDDGRLVANPCRVKGAGTVSAVERPTATLAELQAAVDASPGRFRLAFALAAWCQLRRAEVLGLQRRDVDLLHAELRIVRTVTAHKGRSVIVGPPKTTAGARTLAVPANVTGLLADHLGRYVGPQPDAWVFATAGGGPVSPRYLSRAWSNARKKAGRPDLRLHDLRHTGLTWAAASGASTKDLMRRGGHANERAALRYQHSTRDSDRVLADALTELAARAEIVPLSRDGRAMDGSERETSRGENPG